MAFPITMASPVAYPGPPPAEADVVVIGGGVIGVTTALFLRRKGLGVVLVEKGRVAGEQSSRNWGWIRQQARDPDELPIVIEAQRLWRQLAAETGEDIGLKQVGITYLAKDAKTFASYDEWMPHARAHGVDTRILDAAATAAFLPAMARGYAGAMTTPSDMKAEPWVAVPALARLAAREGVVIAENCAARRLEIAAGRVAGVVTEAGTVRAPRVVLAGGAWSSLFLRAHGVSIPQLAVRSTVAATEPLPEVHAGAASAERVAFRRREDGGYTIAGGGFHDFYIGPDAFRAFGKFMPVFLSDPLITRLHPAAPRGYPDAWGTRRQWRADEETPFERMRILDPKPSPAALARITRSFAAHFPSLGEIRLRAAWAGMIDTMCDVVPVIDHCAAIGGLTIGTGFSGHGFGIGPGAGRILADLVTGDPAGHDLTRFRMSRFTDGSPVRPGPAI